MVSFVIQRELNPDAVSALARHGCVFNVQEESSEVVFPIGTIKVEMWPRVSGDMYELTLPDGYKCEAHYTRYLGQFVIFYQPEKEQSSTQ